MAAPQEEIFVGPYCFQEFWVPSPVPAEMVPIGGLLKRMSLKDFEFERDRFQIETIKIILTLASATLVVSLGFISQTAVLFYKASLYGSWLFLSTSIILGLWAMNAGITRYDATVKGSQGRLEGSQAELYKQGKVLRPFEAQTPRYQQWCFTIGFLFFFLFVFLNSYPQLNW